MNDRVRAALRTAAQTVVGGVVVMLTSLLAAATDWLNGQPVDFVQELSNASRALGLVVVGAASGLVSYVWNTLGTGASYGNVDR